MAESDDMVVTDVSPPSSRRSDEVVGAEPQSEAAAAASAEPRAQLDAVCAEHGRAFQRYLERDFNAAACLYENVQDMQPDRTDIAAALLQERCEKYADAPPGPDWKGVEVLKQKTFDA